MLTRFLAGAACVALVGLAAPVSTAAIADPLAAEAQVSPSAEQAVEAFYASRSGAPLWLGGGHGDAALELIEILDRAPVDGFAQGPAIAAKAQALIARGQDGDSVALTAADRLLSLGWVAYVQALQRPPSGMIYADPSVAPRQQSPMQILALTAAAPSLSAHVESVSQVNPLYAQLRDAAWAEMQSGGSVDPRVLTSLDRARERPFQHKYIMVDAAAARLYMIEDGHIVGSMKVVVGRPGEQTQTPMLASTIYYATVNPYWHVSDDLVRSLIAKNVLEQGLGYLKSHGYQVMPADENDNTLLDPSQIDWHSVASGDLHVRVRQLPGPANSMGRVKFGFPNDDDIYLHDTPMKQLFAQDDRTISHGCIRLEDAQRLERWVLDGEMPSQSGPAEDNVPLPNPVPIYVTYLTAQAHDGQLSFVDDIYGRDSQAAEVAALK